MTAFPTNRNNSICIILAIFLFSIQVPTLAAATGHYARCRITGQTEGLSTNRVTSISKDSLGTFWIGTEKGLDRICEGQIIHYDRTPEFRNKKIIFTATDKTGQVWIGMFSGLYLYDSKGGTFRKMSAEDKWLHPKSYAMVSDGILFLVEEGIAKYEYSTDAINLLYSDIYGYRYGHFCLSGDSSAIVSANADGLYMIDLAKGSKDKIWDFGKDKYVNAMHLDKYGRLWIAFYNKGLVCFSPEKKEIISEFPQDGDFFHGNIALGLHETGNTLCVTTDGGGVLTLDLGTLETSDLQDLLMCRIPEEAESVSTMLMTEDEVWLGTVHHGIVRLKESSIKTLADSDFGLGRGHGPNSSVVTSIAEAPDGKIWIGTDGAGISIYDPVSGGCMPFKSLGDQKVTSVINMNDDWMLVSIYNKGLYKCNLHDGHTEYQPIIDSYTNNKILQQDIVIKLYRTDDGTVLISARDVYLLDPSTGKASQMGISGVSNLRIAHADSECIYTYNLFEINKVNVKSKETERLFYAPAGDISQVKLLKNGLWVIKSDSLFRFAEQEKTLEKTPFRYNGEILSMETDGTGDLWFTTRDRLVRTESSGTYMTFDDADGLSINEFIPDATLCSSKGEVYFGGYSGLCVIQAGNMSDSDEDIRIALLSATVDGSPAGYEASRKTQKNPLITVPWNYSSFDFSICAVGSDVFKTNIFRYTIKEKNKETVLFSNNRLTLPVLAPGRYNIDIAHSDRHDKWISHENVLTIYVTPPRGRIFLIIGLVVIAAAIVIFSVYLYHRREKAKAARLYRQRKEKLAENKIRFMINISHELRTPLTLIYAPLKRLMEKKDGEGIQKSELKGILAQTKYMTQLINMILDSRKLEEGYGKLNLQPHDLNSWLQATVNEFRSEYESKGISIHLEADNNISSVTYDEGKFHIILTNLLMNAWKYSEPHTEVTVRSSEKDGRIRIEVSDQGIGIKGIDTEDLFGRFVQVHKQSSGFGLGLAYTKQLVEAHPGGTIGAFPNETQGSTFWFEIPEGLQDNTLVISRENIITGGYEMPEQDSDATQKITQEDNIVDIDTSAYSVLIAEDEPELLMFLKQELSGSFKKVYAAPDGKEAYAIALKSIPDIIVSDVMMPRMDGYELCRKIKNDIKVSHIPVILLTAQAEQGHRAEGYKSGADIFLSKPFDIPTLISAIRNTLYSREMIKEKYRNISTVPASVAEDTFSNADEQFILKIDKFIDENISNDSLNAQMIAEYACMGRASFYKKVKEILGIGIMEYVTRKRMALAASLLKSTDMQISEIALKAGYPDNQYFSRAFKQHFGQSPSAYRKGSA